MMTFDFSTMRVKHWTQKKNYTSNLGVTVTIVPYLFLLRLLSAVVVVVSAADVVVVVAFV